MVFELRSSAFKAFGEIPDKYTCEGDNISPEVTWREAPEGTRSFVIIVDDPDAPNPASPQMTWVHWVLYNIPSNVQSLPEAIQKMPGGTLQGLNDWRQKGYRGPCPPIGRHRYHFKIYALDIVLPDLETPTKDELLAAMRGHVLGQAEMVASYRKHH